MAYHSILFDSADAAVALDPAPARELFKDLNLDQVFDVVRAGRDEYDLEPFFRMPLDRAVSIRYRHDVLRDLESESLLATVRAFAAGLRTMRSRLSRGENLHHRYQRERWFLEAATVYGGTIRALAAALGKAALHSEGFRGFRDYVASYRESPQFTKLLADAAALATQFSEVRYNLHIKANRIRVGRYNGEGDLGAEVEETFAKFAQGEVREHEFAFRQEPDMDRVEGAVLDMVAELHADAFGALDRFAAEHAAYLDATIAAFDREIQFYLAYLEFIDSYRASGLPFCYPDLAESKEAEAHDAFDLALARKLRRDNVAMVLNDFRLRGRERILVVTGPNQGGKTTFARMIGQLHYLARLGLLVPARQAELFLFDSLFAHFERQEVVENLRGKLEDDLVRIHHIFDAATDRSLVILNESFSATTVDDGLFLGRQVLEELIERDMIAVYVTFLGELATLGRSTVSMVSNVDRKDPDRRTFRFLRQPPEGLAYALAIAEKYKLTYADVKARVVA